MTKAEWLAGLWPVKERAGGVSVDMTRASAAEPLGMRQCAAVTLADLHAAGVSTVILCRRGLPPRRLKLGVEVAGGGRGADVG